MWNFPIFIIAEVKQLLFLEIISNVDVSYRLPDRLIIEYAVFIALIHTKISPEVCKFLFIIILPAVSYGL